MGKWNYKQRFLCGWNEFWSESSTKKTLALPEIQSKQRRAHDFKRAMDVKFGCSNTFGMHLALMWQWFGYGSRRKNGMNIPTPSRLLCVVWCGQNFHCNLPHPQVFTIGPPERQGIHASSMNLLRMPLCTLRRILGTRRCRSFSQLISQIPHVWLPAIKLVWYPIIHYKYVCTYVGMSICRYVRV